MSESKSKNVFVVTSAGLERGMSVKMQAATFRERQDLQEWLIENPDIIEPGFTVLTSEFADWETPQGEKQRDRLDILGIDEEGRIVVVELKRGACPDATDMQAVKYAALASQFTVQTLLEAHRVFLRSRGHEISFDDLHARFQGRYKGYDNIEAKVGIPRIVIVAEEFPPIVTSSVAFLFGVGLSIKLIQFAVTRFDRMPDAYTMTFETLFPPPGMESFISTPRTPTISQALDQEAVEGEARQQNIVGQIIAAGHIPAGAPLDFRMPYKIEDADKVEAWLTEHRPVVTWNPDTRPPLMWGGEKYSPTGLAKLIVREATGREPRTLRGPDWWTYQGMSLVDMARGDF